MGSRLALIALRLSATLADGDGFWSARMSANLGRLAVGRGPLVYSLEQHELPASVSVFDVALPAGQGKLQGGHRSGLLSGIYTISTSGVAGPPPLARMPLYQTAAPTLARPAAAS